VQYQYNLDVDGNGWSSRFHRLLSTGSPVIKMAMFPDWNQVGLGRRGAWGVLITTGMAQCVVVFVHAMWYIVRLNSTVPWYHYIPLKVDYEDLYDIMAFFVGPIDEDGNIDFAQGHPVSRVPPSPVT
jgi:hypothetical protein